MFITDSQVHIWCANTPERPWRAGERSHRQQPLGADELLREMDAAGVHRAVLVPPFLDGDRNDLVVEAARLHPHIRRVYDKFGPQRTFWGSDMSRLPCTYRQGVTMFTEEMPWFPAGDLDWIMGRGLCGWLGWKPPLGTV